LCALCSHAAPDSCCDGRVGSFSAASNVTGVVTDVDAVTELLHRGGALACWDYASAAAHLPIDMNPVVIDAAGTANPWVSKDAVFVSPHKLPGGVGAPGLLLAKRALFRNAVPTEPGGGTVFFVTDQDHRCVPSSILCVTIAPPLWDPLA